VERELSGFNRGQTGISVQPTPTSQAGDAGANPAGQAVVQGRPVTLRAMLAYRTSDRLSEGLIYFIVVFSPWAFGTSSTQPWTVWVMNVAGYALGAMLSVKLAIRSRTGYEPSRWCGADGGLSSSETPAPNGAARFLTAGLAFLTAAILLYCLVAALNARATYNPLRMDFTYHTYLNWLPHSYDSNRTRQIFFNYLALACSFWAVRDWLLGKSAGEERAARNHTSSHRRVSYFPARLRRLLWLLSLNGALLGAQGVAQRFSDSGKLLWLVEPRVNKTVDSQFGPFAYRANAAQYMNLVWPAALGLWWRLRPCAFGVRPLDGGLPHHLHQPGRSHRRRREHGRRRWDSAAGDAPAASAREVRRRPVFWRGLFGGHVSRLGQARGSHERIGRGLPLPRGDVSDRA
jgi:hypothetical protein